MKQLTLLLVTLLLGSCVTYNKCLDKFGTLAKDSVSITVKQPIDTTITATTKADSLDGWINLDTLCFEWYASNDSLLIANDSLRTVSITGKLSTEHWVDRYNRLLRFKSKKEVDTVEIILRDTVTVKVDCPPVASFDKNKKRPWYGTLWQGYQFFAAWALLVLLFVLVFLKKIKTLFS